MADTRNQLVQEALQIGSRHKHREVDAKKRQNALRLEVQKEEAIADAARLAFERSLNFGATLGADYLCPRCWVARGARAELVAIDSPTGDVDDFRCRACHDEYSFPA